MAINRKIKLIWDFNGPDAEGIAKHHAIHLNDYKLAEQDDTIINCDYEKVSENNYIAFLITHQSEMVRLRDKLLPKRGVFIE